MTEQTIFIEIIGDTAVEPDEIFLVQLRNPVNAPIGNATATVTILNDDGLAIGDVRQAEGTGTAPTAFTFTVTLPTAQTGPVTVNFATEAGTAASGTDFAATSGTVTFAAGETSKTVTVNVVADTATEADETFVVRLSNATGAPIADATATGTIVNDDGIVIDDVVVTEGTGTGTTNAQVTIRLLSAATVPVSVNWQTADGTAIAGQDYTQSSGVVTFAIGETSKTVSIPITRDALAESEENFRVVLSAPVGAAIVDADATVRILDDDGFSIADAVVTEGQSGTRTLSFQVSLASALITSTQVSYATVNGTATAGSDYTAASGLLTFSPGQTTATVSVTVAGDTTPEADETLTVVLSNPVGSQIVRGTATGTIYNDDGVSITDISVVEGPTRTIAVTVSLSGAAATPITVNYQTRDGTATAGLDYTATSGSLTFAAGETSKTINVGIIDDTIFEGNETFQILLTAGANATIVDGIGTVTITNDDTRPPPSLAIVDASVTEGSGGGTGFLRFQVALSEVRTTDTVVNFATVAGTAVAPADYVETSGQLTILAGSRFSFISVPVVRDGLIEAAETLTVQLSNPSSGVTISRATATGTILNDDIAYSVNLLTESQFEGNGVPSTFQFIVQRQGDSLAETSVNWRFVGSGATPANAADFVGGALPTGVIRFQPGQTTNAVLIDVLGDSVVESDETFILELFSPVPTDATLANSQQAFILNDDSSLSIAATDASRFEANSGTTPFTFTVTRTGSLNFASTAN